MIQDEREEFSEIGIELQLDLDEKNSDQEDDEFGNKNYVHVKSNDLVRMSQLDSVNPQEVDHKYYSDSHLEHSVHQDEQQVLEFNPDQRPPNLTLALKHANRITCLSNSSQIIKRARRVGINKQLAENDSVKDSFCPCCGNQIENELLPITVEREKLGFLGSGVPLFFEWMIFIMVLCLILIFCSIYSMIKNLQGDGCELKDECSQTFLIFNFEINRIMTANRKNEYIDHTVSKINFLATVFLILVTIIYQSLFKSIDKRIESRFITPSHFTIMAENIPLGTTDQQIKKFFQEVIPNERIEVVKVVQGYEISDLSKIKKLRTRLIKKENTLFGREYILKEQIREKRNADRKQQVVVDKKKKKKSKKKETTLQQDIEELKEIDNDKIELRKKILRIDKNISEIGRSFSTHLKNTGYAFISFKNEDNVQKITDYFPTNDMQRFFSYLCCQNNQSFMGSYIKVSKAPEPGDILWENLVVSKQERFKRRGISLFYQAISVVVSFLSIYLVKIFQSFIKDESGGNKIVEYVSLGISILTFVINTILSRIIKNLAVYEKHPTYTKYLISVDKSLGIAQFINSILISVIADHLENGRDLMTKGGVILSIQYNVLINTFTPLFNQFFNMWYAIRLSRRKKIIKQGEKCSLTQYEAHKIFEGTTFNADKNYSITIRLMLVNCFVAYICPNVIIWNLLIIIADYWLEKYLLLRRHSSPPAISGELFFANIKYFNDLYIVVYSAGCCYWQYMIYGEVDDWTQVQLQFSLFYYFMPIQKIISFCTEHQQNPNTHKTYKNVSQFFFNDYDRANPATSQQAQNEYMQKVEMILRRERVVTEIDHVSQSFLRNSILKAAPGKVIPQSESFPFFQNRNINPLLNEPIMIHFLDPSPKKMINQVENAQLQNLFHQEDSQNKFSHGSLKKRSHNTLHAYENLNQLQLNKKQNSHSIGLGGLPKLERFLTVQHDSDNDHSNKFTLNLFQIQNQSPKKNENEIHHHGESLRPSIFSQQAHTPIRRLDQDPNKGSGQELRTDQVLLDQEKHF